MANLKIKKRRVKERVTLYDELRLVELSDTEVNGIWKGAHLLLFFLAFVFGAFCTFCFHMLMYMFDEKCVLFPKLLSLSGTRHSVLFDFMPNKDEEELLPVDFVSTQWGEKSTCYLPTYVPLLSGLFGLVWTTMFLMCSSGGNSLSGFQRSWRIIPSVFVFSIFMSVLCIYASTITQWGLQDMCAKLGEITGSTTCTYTINVATLVYDRRIRGVYQAVKLTIMTAWLHTFCWILAAVLALVRVLLVVDFGLVRIRADLQGDIDKMLERHEKHIRTVSPDILINTDMSTNTQGDATTDTNSIILHFKNESFSEENHINPSNYSTLSLVPDEEHKLIKLAIFNSVPEECKFIPELVYKVLDQVVPKKYEYLRKESIKLDEISEPILLTRQRGKEILNRETNETILLPLSDENDTDESKISCCDTLIPTPKTSKKDIKRDGIIKKTILKTRSVQTDGKDKKSSLYQKVQIIESENTSPVSLGDSSDETLKQDDVLMTAEQTTPFDYSEMIQDVETQTGKSMILRNEQVENKISNISRTNIETEDKTRENVKKNQAYENHEKYSQKSQESSSTSFSDVAEIENNEKKEQETSSSSSPDVKETENNEKKEQETKTIGEKVEDDEEVEIYKVFEPKKKGDQETQVNEKDLEQDKKVKKFQNKRKDKKAKIEQASKAYESKNTVNKETNFAETQELETQTESSSKHDKNVQTSPKNTTKAQDKAKYTKIYEQANKATTSINRDSKATQLAHTPESDTLSESSGKDDKNVQTNPKEKQD